MDCLFCKIVAGEIPSQKVYEDDQILAFRDISPAAPVHILFIPKQHIENTNSLTSDHGALIGHIFATIPEVMRAEGVADSGYRVVANTNPNGGQTVYHLHFHVLGGRPMTWPPG